MAKSNQIKQLLKQDGIWKEYKSKFENKQMRFVFTFVANEYVPTAPIADIIKAEKLILAAPKGPDMFVKGFEKMHDLIEKNSNFKSTADWKSFARFLWYQYQTSTYWKDVKKGTPNIFSEKTFIKENSNKRDQYQKWVDTLNKTRHEFNVNLVDILKKVS